MKTDVSNKPSEGQITNYGCFALLFTEISNLLYTTYEGCHEVEKGAAQELRRIRRLKILHFVGLVIFPYLYLSFQLNDFLKNMSITNGIVTLTLTLIVFGLNAYLFVLLKRLAKERKSVIDNLDTINDMYSRLLSSAKVDFSNFINKKFENISFFDGLTESDKKRFIGALDTLNIDLNVLNTAFRHSSFININPQMENKLLRENALKHIDADFKVFENLAS